MLSHELTLTAGIARASYLTTTPTWGGTEWSESQVMLLLLATDPDESRPDEEGQKAAQYLENM